MPDETPTNPKVFVIHASEDKDRFVLAFSRDLRRSGIDAWLDLWEMLPGHSLVDKIFEEGLRNASAVIVVLSENSVDKPWVREELNAAIVKRINEGSLIIPLVLDGVKVPKALESTLWEPIDDLTDYTASLERVRAAIFDQRLAPPLGDPPKYAVADLPKIHGLAPTDVVTLREFGAVAVATGDWISVGTDDVWSRVQKTGVSRDDFLDALKILSDRYWLERSPELSPTPQFFKVTVSGLEEYLTRFYAGYPSLFRRVTAAVVNDGITENKALASHLGEPKILVDHVLRRLKDRRLARIYEAIGGYIEVSEVYPELRRWLRT
jgi:hypothetical protein